MIGRKAKNRVPMVPALAPITIAFSCSVCSKVRSSATLSVSSLVSQYIPEGWTIQRRGQFGAEKIICPDCRWKGDDE